MNFTIALLVCTKSLYLVSLSWGLPRTSRPSNATTFCPLQLYRRSRLKCDPPPIVDHCCCCVNILPHGGNKFVFIIIISLGVAVVEKYLFISLWEKIAVDFVVFYSRSRDSTPCRVGWSIDPSIHPCVGPSHF